MKSKGKRAVLAASAAFLAAVLAGCGSAEYTAGRRNSIAVVRAGTQAEYALTTVRRGDIALTESVRVTYFAARSQAYGFETSGIYYESFEVAVGDTVKPGDVLATLECAQLDQEIADCEARIASYTLERDRNQALLTRYDARMEGRASAENRASDARRRQYEVAIRDAEDAMEVLRVRMDELTAQRTGRVIVADIGGTVTYVRAVQPGESSVKGRTVVEITDLDSCAFNATVEHPDAISFEETYAVVIDGAEYAIRRTTAEALGIEDVPMNEKSTRTKVYFTPLVPSVNLKNDSSGRFTVTVDTREDALYVPTNAIAEADGKTCVYVLDEYGLKSVREITVGLTTARSCEILSGLQEGDQIIAY